MAINNKPQEASAGADSACIDCAWERMPLSIFTPANCRKLTELRQITGCGDPGNTISVEIDSCPPFTAEVMDCGRFEIRNPYMLDTGYHTINICYQNCKCGASASTWVYIQRMPPAPPVISLLEVSLNSLETAKCRGAINAGLTVEGYEGKLTFYYLMLTPGMPVPTPKDIINFDEERLLTNGTAARGRFFKTVSSDGTSFERALTGREGEIPLPGEAGLLDGRYYDVYIYAAAGKVHSKVLKSMVPVKTLDVENNDC